MPEPAATVGALLDRGARLLGGGREGMLEAEVLLGHALGRSREWMLAHGEEEAGPAGGKFLSMAFERQATGMPVAYLTGEREFYGLTLKVGPGVLVPRPETEGLVDLVLDWTRANGARFPGASIVDAGCGSGAVALALARTTGRMVLGTDRSLQAVEFSRLNAAALGLSETVEFALGDWLQPVRSRRIGPPPLAVVSNPPYIPSGELAGLPRDVRDFEPVQALDGGADGLACLRVLEGEAWAVLPPGGLLALEIGAEQGPAVDRILAARGWREIRVSKDLAGLDRYVLAESRG